VRPETRSAPGPGEAAISCSGELSNSVPAKVSSLPGITAATTVYDGQFEFQKSLASLAAVSTANLADRLILRMTSGTPAALAKGELRIASSTANSRHLAVGDTVSVRFDETGRTVLRIGGIYQANALIGSYVVSSGFFLSHFSIQPPDGLLLRTDDSSATERAVNTALARYVNVQVQTTAQFGQSETSSVNQLLGPVYALLALAVLIALIGIVNTLLLSEPDAASEHAPAHSGTSLTVKPNHELYIRRGVVVLYKCRGKLGDGRGRFRWAWKITSRPGSC
jgi:putative ABC transport system permease protein